VAARTAVHQETIMDALDSDGLDALALERCAEVRRRNG
jgi:hypothetical protein